MKRQAHEALCGRRGPVSEGQSLWPSPATLLAAGSKWQQVAIANCCHLLGSVANSGAELLRGGHCGDDHDDDEGSSR